MIDVGAYTLQEGRRVAFAWEAVKECRNLQDQRLWDNYRSEVRRAGADLYLGGLALMLANLKARAQRNSKLNKDKKSGIYAQVETLQDASGNAQALLLCHIKAWLCELELYPVEEDRFWPDFLESSAASARQRVAIQETKALIIWLKRFVEKEKMCDGRGKSMAADETA